MATERKLNADLMRYISLFETITNTAVKDCMETDDRLLFVVASGHISKAIGKKGDNIVRLNDMMKKNIHVIEFSTDTEQFLKNIFRSYNVKSVEIEERENVKHATVTVDKLLKGKAIGKEGRNLKVARDLIARHTDITSVSVA